MFVRHLDSTGHPTYTRYESPYTDLPRLTSHAHPFFVLYFAYGQIVGAPCLEIPQEIYLPITIVRDMWSLGVPSDFYTTTSCATSFDPSLVDSSQSIVDSGESESRGTKRPRDDEEESSSASTATSPASGSIQTPKDLPSSYKRPKMFESGVLCDTDSLLYWIQGMDD